MNEITEEDITKVINYLKIHEPKNADREYAVQLLESMNEYAKELVNQDLEFAELIAKALVAQKAE